MFSPQEREWSFWRSPKHRVQGEWSLSRFHRDREYEMSESHIHPSRERVIPFGVSPIMEIQREWSLMTPPSPDTYWWSRRSDFCSIMRIRDEWVSKSSHLKGEWSWEPVHYQAFEKSDFWRWLSDLSHVRVILVEDCHVTPWISDLGEWSLFKIIQAWWTKEEWFFWSITKSRSTFTCLSVFSFVCLSVFRAWNIKLIWIASGIVSDSAS